MVVGLVGGKVDCRLRQELILKAERRRSLGLHRFRSFFMSPKGTIASCRAAVSRQRTPGEPSLNLSGRDVAGTIVGVNL